MPETPTLLALQTREMVFRPFGWAVRLLMRVKDNYFGQLSRE